MTRSIDVEVSAGSALELFPFRVNPDADQFIVGRPATGSYVALSGGALAAVELLQAGQSVEAAKAALARDHPGQAIRLRPLLETLVTAGLVKAIDGASLIEVRMPRRYHLAFLRRSHVAWLYSAPAAAAYLALLGLGTAVAFAHPEYLPRLAHALVTADPLTNLALLWGVSLLAMAVHEMAHLAAATFLGVRASFALGHRFFFAVAQTDLTDLWLVDRRKRYLAYAAGMVNDVLLACAAVTALWLTDHGWLPIPAFGYRTLRLLVLVLAVGVLWQFNLFLRTDVYYLVANFTGCRNLSGDATAYLKALLARLWAGAASDPLDGLPENEKRLVRSFAGLKVVGTAGVAALGAACFGGLIVLLVGQQASPQGAPASLLPLLASLGITACWLAHAAIAGRRRRPRVRYRLIGPEDL